MQTIESKVALITGGSKGIGYGVAAALLEKGVHVALTSRNKASALAAADKLNVNTTTAAKAIGIVADVRDYESQQEAVAKGLGKFGSIEDLSIEDWQAVIDTNLTGTFYTIKAGVAALKQSKGYFITISSLAGTNFFAGGAAYNASKFGVTGFTQAVMLDLRQQGIKVSTIMPGSVSTHFNNNEPNASDAWKIQIEDIGKLVVDLLEMHPRTLPSKIEVRPTTPPSK
jgi:NAD(P)-dependent dehydrogenase (short-subunit alcohol dehydrogenase family)